MPSTPPPPTLAELTAEFFGGEVPAQFTADTVREALARQIAQCHAMISLEFEECLSPPEEIYDAVLCARENAYDRVDRLAGTIAVLTGILLPRADDNVKRHALKIEVERRAPPAPGGDAAAALPALAATPSPRRRK